MSSHAERQTENKRIFFRKARPDTPSCVKVKRSTVLMLSRSGDRHRPTPCTETAIAQVDENTEHTLFCDKYGTLYFISTTTDKRSLCQMGR